MITRTFAVLAVSAAMTAAALPAQAVEESVSVRDRLGQIGLVDDAVPVAQSPLEPVRRNGEVTLGSGATAFSLGLPVSGESRVRKVDGRYAVPASDGASLAVGPTTSGAQVLIGIEDRDAPTTYDFAVGGSTGVAPAITPDGGVQVTDARGSTVAQIAAPWAIDAEGRHVPTRFAVRHGTVTQIVDHRAGDFAYPIVADPKIFACDLYTSICAKFSKKETKKIWGKLKKVDASKQALAAFICAKIPHPIIAIGCAASVFAAIPSLRKTFRSAVAKKQCVELHFRATTGLLFKWKKEKC